MVVADYVAIGLVAVFAVFGLIAGFGKSLKFFTSGIFGFIIGVVVAYFLGSYVMSWPFVTEIMTNIVDYFGERGNVFGDIMVTIHIEIIAVYVALFIVVQIVRIIIVAILKSFFEINNGFFKVINRLFGIVLLLAVLAMLALIAFQIVVWIGGGTADKFSEWLNGSIFKLDLVYENNPLRQLTDYLEEFKNSFGNEPDAVIGEIIGNLR